MADPFLLDDDEGKQAYDKTTAVMTNIVAKLEEGIELSQAEVDFLIDENDQGIMDFLFGSSSNFFYGLSEKAQSTLRASTSASEAMDLGMVQGEPIFIPGVGGKLTEYMGAEAPTVAAEAAAKSAPTAVTQAQATGLRQAVGSWAGRHRILGFPMNHPRITLAAGAFGAYLWSRNQADQEAYSNLYPQEQGLPEQVPTDEPMIIIDGQAIPISQLDPGLASPAITGSAQSFGGASGELGQIASQYGIDPNILGGGMALQGINPYVMGTMEVSPGDYPFGVGSRGEPIQSAQGPGGFIPRRTSPGMKGPLPTEDAAAAAGFGVAAPPGAALNPAVFAPSGIMAESTLTRPSRNVEYGPDGYVRGTVTEPAQTEQSLMQVAAAAGRKYGVPIDIMYGVVNATSGWNPRAVGQGGTAYGLGQIPENRISPTAAQNPAVALNYVAANLKYYHDRYESWEMAALAYRNPAAVQRLLKDGTIEAGDKDYLGHALESAAGSGLGNNQFDFAGLAALSTRSGGGGGGGPSIPPFVEPDRAALREYARTAVESIYGRSSNDEELNQFVEMLVQGYKDAYEQQVIQIRGGTSVDVDPQARLVDYLRESGEAKFYTERQQQRSIFDTMGDWAQILRQA